MTIITNETKDSIEHKNTFSLRIRESKYEGKHLTSCIEWWMDDHKIELLEGHPAVGHLEAVCVYNGEGFKREFLYSKGSGQHILTMSGYTFTGDVDLYSWQIRSKQEEKRLFPVNIDPKLLPDMVMIHNTQLYHVAGDEENIHAGLDDAIKTHLERIKDIEPQTLTLEETAHFYHALISHIPK